MHVCMHEKRQEAVFEGRVTLLGKCKETIYLPRARADRPEEESTSFSLTR